MHSANVALVRASKNDEGTLRNLLHLYVHDFSEFLGMKPSEDGLFSYPALPRYFSEPGRAAFLIQSEGALVGFALISQGSEVTDDPAVFDVAEFFVVRGVRRRGVGQAAAHELFRHFPGRWEVRVAAYNVAAHRFWLDVITHFTGGVFQSELWTRQDGSQWTVFGLTSKGAAEEAGVAPTTSLKQTREG